MVWNDLVSHKTSSTPLILKGLLRIYWYKTSEEARWLLTLNLLMSYRSADLRPLRQTPRYSKFAQVYSVRRNRHDDYFFLTPPLILIDTFFSKLSPIQSSAETEVSSNLDFSTSHQPPNPTPTHQPNQNKSFWGYILNFLLTSILPILAGK